MLNIQQLKKLLTLCSLLLLVKFAYPQIQDQFIVQFNQSVNVPVLINDKYNNTNSTFLNPIKCLSNSLNIWLVEATPLINSKHISNKELSDNILSETEEIKWLQLNQQLELRENIPNDYLFNEQWQYLNNGYERGLIDVDIDAPEAWDVTTGGKTSANDDIVVAIIDSAVNLYHPDLKDNIWENKYEILGNNIDDDGNGYVDDVFGWNFNNSNNNVNDDNDGSSSGHGSSVAGIIGAKGNNEIGVCGVNWNVKMMGLVANSSIADIIAAYDYVLDMRLRYNESGGAEGAFVVATNTSLGINRGWPEDAPVWCTMYDALGEAGIVSVASTTNSNINVDTEGDLPTTCTSPYLISVTNTTESDLKGIIAGYGSEHIDLGAPGSSILTTSANGEYGFFNGTSASAPLVAGAVALLYSIDSIDFLNDVRQFPSELALRIKDFIMNGVDKIDSLSSITLSGGRLNLNNSVLEFKEFYGDKTIDDSFINLIEVHEIYPNPIYDNLYINVSLQRKTNVEIQVFNILGQTAMTRTIENLDSGFHEVLISLSHLQDGFYYIMFNNGYKKKIIKF